MEKVVRFSSVVIVRTVKTSPYDTSCTPKRIVIPMVLLHKVTCWVNKQEIGGSPKRA